MTRQATPPRIPSAHNTRLVCVCGEEGGVKAELETSEESQRQRRGMMPCSTAICSKLEREKQLVARELSLSATYSGLVLVMWPIRRIM